MVLKPRNTCTARRGRTRRRRQSGALHVATQSSWTNSAVQKSWQVGVENRAIRSTVAADAVLLPSRIVVPDPFFIVPFRSYRRAHGPRAGTTGCFLPGTHANFTAGRQCSLPGFASDCPSWDEGWDSYLWWWGGEGGVGHALQRRHATPPYITTHHLLLS